MKDEEEEDKHTIIQEADKEHEVNEREETENQGLM